MTLRAAPYTLTYLQLNVNNVFSMNAISFKLWQLICEMYMEGSYKFYIMPMAQSADIKEVHERFIGTTLVCYQIRLMLRTLFFPNTWLESLSI